MSPVWMRSLKGLLIAAGALSVSSAAQPTGSGAAQVIDNKLTRDGRPWTPHGFYQIAFEVPPAVAAQLATRTVDPQTFWQIAAQNYSPQEYVDMRRAGADSVRLQVAQTGMDPENPLFDSRYAAKAIGAVLSARKAGLTVILSIQDEPQTGSVTQAPLPDDATRRIWTYLAPIYGRDPGVIYELYNEPSPAPSPQNWTAWKSAMDETIRTIRNMGARNVLVADGLGQGKVLDGAPLLDDPDNQVVYSSHPYANNADQQLQNFYAAEFAAFSQRAPVIISEWGPTFYCDQNTASYTVEFQKFINGLGIGLEAAIWDFSGPHFRTVNWNFPATQTSTFIGPEGHVQSCAVDGNGPGKTVEAWYRSGTPPNSPL